jgi:hypothetical protein
MQVDEHIVLGPASTLKPALESECMDVVPARMRDEQTRQGTPRLNGSYHPLPGRTHWPSGRPRDRCRARRSRTKRGEATGPKPCCPRASVVHGRWMIRSFDEAAHALEGVSTDTGNQRDDEWTISETDEHGWRVSSSKHRLYHVPSARGKRLAGLPDRERGTRRVRSHGERREGTHSSRRHRNGVPHCREAKQSPADKHRSHHRSALPEG